ncbi:MAG: hypothetical protein ABI330_07485 [Caldimonas sp.]
MRGEDGKAVQLATEQPEELRKRCPTGYVLADLEAPLMVAVPPDVLVDIDCTELTAAADRARLHGAVLLSSSDVRLRTSAAAWGIRNHTPRVVYCVKGETLRIESTVARLSAWTHLWPFTTERAR